ncbi:hypothetical protein B0H16DRAFT_1468254 [Mycena metata]|uniref:Uncharacterized protein n=1 Tax=Mycena metata TaxID=1033252 RepID=A0AAD7MV09_9AGAR|nr:hypothetical protein B0H16DRAFT_1468254 [Mycena metata]
MLHAHTARRSHHIARHDDRLARFALGQHHRTLHNCSRCRGILCTALPLSSPTHSPGAQTRKIRNKEKGKKEQVRLPRPPTNWSTFPSVPIIEARQKTAVERSHDHHPSRKRDPAHPTAAHAQRHLHMKRKPDVTTDSVGSRWTTTAAPTAADANSKFAGASLLTNWKITQAQRREHKGREGKEVARRRRERAEDVVQRAHKRVRAVRARQLGLRPRASAKPAALHGDPTSTRGCGGGIEQNRQCGTPQMRHTVLNAAAIKWPSNRRIPAAKRPVKVRVCRTADSGISSCGGDQGNREKGGGEQTEGQYTYLVPARKLITARALSAYPRCSFVGRVGYSGNKRR